MPTENDQRVELPGDLRTRFLETGQKLYATESVLALSRSITALSAGYLALFLADRFFTVPEEFRLVCLFVAVGVTIWAIVHWLRRWVWTKRTDRELAKLVQLKYRRLGDRLLSIVELSEEDKHPGNFSPELYKAAVSQVSDEARRYDFEAAVDTKPTERLVKTAGTLVILIVLGVLIVPRASLTSLVRFIQPWKEVPRYELVQLADFPTQMIVAHGEGFRIRGTVNYRSFWTPATASLSLGNLNLERKVENGELQFDIPGQTLQELATIQVGDGQQVIRIKPVHRPALTDLDVEIQLPDYLQYPKQNASATSGRLLVLPGTQAKFQATASRPLVVARSNYDQTGWENLEPKGSQFQSEWINLTNFYQGLFDWTDVHGLTNKTPFSLSIDYREDLAPDPRWTAGATQATILENEVLEIALSSADDYGLKETGIEWTSSNENEEISEKEPHSFVVPSVNTQEINREDRFLFSPAVWNIPPDSLVDITGFANDFLPNREKTSTDPLRIYVVGLEDHFAIVQGEMEGLLAELEDVTRLQDQILADTQDLNLKEAESQNDQASTKQLEKLAQQQAENAQQLQALANEGMETLKDAMRNSEFDESTIKEWAESLATMQEMSQKTMPQASSKLGEASQSESPQERAEALSEAQSREEAILEQLNQLQQNINQDLDKLEAMTLAQRLRKVAEDEDKISERLQIYVKQTIGLRADELSEKFVEANERLADEQELNKLETATLQEELGRFFERTENEPYGTVFDEMKETKAPASLEILRDKIRANISMESIALLAQWSTQFRTWADIIDPPQEADSESGEGSGSSSPEEQEPLVEYLTALVRARSDEASLREQTRLLEGEKQEGETYAESATNLKTRQLSIREKVRSVQLETLMIELETTLDEAYQSMVEVEEKLGQPDTGKTTIDLQNKTIVVLTDAINIVNEKIKRENQKSSSQSPSQSSSQQMAFLLQMLQQAQTSGISQMPGQQEGTNSSGGSTERPTEEQQGNFAGETEDERKVQIGSGLAQDLPAEYREAFEAYFEALEQNEFTE